MQTAYLDSESLARLRESVAQTRQRVAERGNRRDEDALLAEPIAVAADDTPSARQRARQLDTLRQAHVELAHKVSQLEERAGGESFEVLKHLSSLEGRVQELAVQNQASSAADSATRTSLAQQAKAQRALETMQTIQAAVGVASTLQSTAYGQRGSLLSANNLLLAGNQLLWTYIDPIAKFLELPVGPAPSPLAYCAPLLSLVTARVVLGDRQHVRFITGITEFGPGEDVRLDLRSRIADRLWPEFQQRADVTVTAQPLGPRRNLSVFAEVRHGTLRLNAATRDRAKLQGLRVAWIVDTGEDVG
jgi:hypothetical protein